MCSATIVNYACHPTTLAWENTLISPDYIGAMRELVEAHTGGAPCLFLHGASGELGPAHQYVGDPAVADQHGRRLGFSALSALEGMLAARPGAALRGRRRVRRPARGLAAGAVRALAACSSGGAVDVPLPLKPLPTAEELEAQLAATEDRALQERLFRKLQIVSELSGGEPRGLPGLGLARRRQPRRRAPERGLLVFQEELRRAFPDATVVVMNTSGAEMGYLYPPALDGRDLYQVWQTPFAKEALADADRALHRGGAAALRRRRPA